jgi:hypothetical protein
MGRGEHDRWCLASVIRLFPSPRAQTPSIASLQPRKLIGRIGSRKVVAACATETKKLISHHRANDMNPGIRCACVTTTVTIKPGHRVGAAGNQFGAKDVLGACHLIPVSVDRFHFYLRRNVQQSAVTPNCSKIFLDRRLSTPQR